MASREDWLTPLFRPKSVAVVGASPRLGSAGSNVVANLLACGFEGEIFPVNPKYPEIHGLRSYASLSEIERPIDAVFIALAAEQGPVTLRAAVEAGVRAGFVNGTNYADGGPEGVRRQAELTRIAHEGGMALCGPNNLGLINVIDRIPLWTSGHLPPLRPGPVAVISQSGSVALALAEDVCELGLSHVITAGNEAVCGIGDYVDGLAGDPRVSVILLFLETIRSPASLAAAAGRACARGKTIIATKIGRSDAARAAVAAHSGALSGEDVVCDAFFRKHGIIRAADPDELVQLARLFLIGSRPRPGTGPVFITLSGGEGAALADYAGDVGLRIPDFTQGFQDRVASLFPRSAPPRNPMDAWGLGWDPKRFEAIFDALMDEPGLDPIVFSLDIPESGGADGPMGVEMAGIAGARAGRGKHILFAANSAICGVHPNIKALCREHQLPLLRGAALATRAIATWTKATASTPTMPVEQSTPAAGTLLERDDIRLHLEQSGAVHFVAAETARSATQAIAIAERLGYPLVLKGLAPKASHKTELNLVRLSLRCAADVREAFSAVATILAEKAEELGAGWIEVQPMIEGGLELLVAARRDPVFGPVVVAGSGGRLVELLQDSAVRLGAISVGEAESMLNETRLAALLRGYRDGRRFDVEAACRAIAAVSRILDAADPGVRAIEINPLMVLPEGRGVVAVDYLVE